MSSFDLNVWKERAKKKRHKRETDYFIELGHIESISRIVDWCKSHDIDVQFKRLNDGEGGRYDHCIFAGKSITISPAYKTLTKIHVLLHECGHYIIEVEHPEKYLHGHAAALTDGRSRKSWIHKVDVIGEEIEAWERGWELGESLGIWTNPKLDREMFDKTKIDNVKTYIKWACNTDGY